MRYLSFFFLLLFLVQCTNEADLIAQIDTSPIYAEHELRRSTVCYTNAPSVTNTMGYGSRTELLADIYQPPNESGRLRPAIVLLHGGAYAKGSREDLAVQVLAIELAQRGFVAVSIDYRLNLIRDFSFIKSGYAAQQDARAAVRYVRANADELKVHPKYIALGGISAGAVSALTAAFIRPNEPILDRLEMLDDRYGDIDAAGAYQEYSADVYACVSLGGGILDPALFDAQDRTSIIYAHGTDDSWIPYYKGVPDCLAPYQLVLKPFSAELPPVYGPGVWGEGPEKAPVNVYGLSLPGSTHNLLISERGTRQRTADQIIDHVIISLMEAARAYP